MRICSKCVLPETYPGISFDEKGVCNYCNNPGHSHNIDIISESSLEECFKRIKALRGRYDVLVPLSGGVDSSVALISLVEKYGLKPLGFHNDHGYEYEIATENVRKLCRSLNVDLIIRQHDYSLMKKIWRTFNRSCVAGLHTCYACANFILANALEIACLFNINLVVTGYSKAQALLTSDIEKAAALSRNIFSEIEKTGDKDFMEECIRKFRFLSKMDFCLSEKALTKAADSDKTAVIPFYGLQILDYNKDQMKKECAKLFGWIQLPHSYPSGTTNCQMNWLNSYLDNSKFGYNPYHEEYAIQVRENLISRDRALRELELNPPEGVIERLASNIGIENPTEGVKFLKV